MKIITAMLIIATAILLSMILTSCAVQKPVVKQFTITKIYDGYFAARNGKTVLLFGTQENDSAYIGKVINVSIGRK